MDNELKSQLPLFSSDGQYPDPNTPMAYDIFPRHYLDIMILRGYNGQYRATMEELLLRGAWTSLLIQSPNGEWPNGGRSSQHQWNEAVETVIYELYASRMKAAGNMVAAKAFKRAARLALQSVRRWIQPNKEDIYILKNQFNPSLRFGYEEYSFLSNYNNLPSSMLGYAYLFADDTIPEGPSFAEIGGFALKLDVHHKVFANAGGMYLEIETAADPDYDNTGLMRIHKTNFETLIGPTGMPHGHTYPLALGVTWTKGTTKESLAQFWKGTVNTTLDIIETKTDSVQFIVTYDIQSKLVSTVTEKYSVSPTIINVTSTIKPISTVDSLGVTFPAFDFDGVTNSTFTVDNQAGRGEVRFMNSYQVFAITSPFSSFALSSNRIATRNGYTTYFSGISKDMTEISYSIQPHLMA
jgi:hypothetical protein